MSKIPARATIEPSGRPTIVGTKHLVSSCHYLASTAAFQILEAGGNAIDAGVCAGLALGVLEGAYVSIAGVAPIAIYLADKKEVLTISGLGTWPKAASCEFFLKNHRGEIPKGVLRTVVPAAPDAWIMALERYGTMSFGDIAAASIRFARDGYPIYPLMTATIKANEADIRAFPTTVDLFLPGGKAPAPGDVFRQEKLAQSLEYMVDEERAAAARGRASGLQAARNAFYRGDIARAIVTFHEESGGLLAMDDMAEFHVDVETAIKTRFRDIDVYGCGPWCQGPMLLQEIAILNGVDLAALGHNSSAYVHLVTEAIKLAAADREACYGDPRFVDVPLERLLSMEYARERRAMIRADRAFTDMPPSGVASSARAAASRGGEASARGMDLDTSYVCAVDRHGNAFSATPSDAGIGAPVIPGVGFAVSARGFQSWTDPSHPSSIMPGKRPRLTPNPAIAIRDGDFVMPFGTPGHDTQTQVMLQTFLNMFVFDMEPQQAVEAPRFATLSFPSSAFPHQSQPGRLLVEDPTYAATHEALAKLGHKVERWPDDGPDYFMNASSACLAIRDEKTGIVRGAADPRRPSSAVGW